MKFLNRFLVNKLEFKENLMKNNRKHKINSTMLINPIMLNRRMFNKDRIIIIL